jgi:hypothetical protein
MNYQTQKNAETQQNLPLNTSPSAPMYSSPWMALYLHLKANLNQNSVS